MEATRERIRVLTTSLEAVKRAEALLVQQLGEEESGQQVFEFVQDKDDKSYL